MPLRSPRVWLTDIRTEIAGIQELTRNADLATFRASWAMKRAVEQGLLIIAEAAKHLPPDLKQSQPQVPWERIHGLSNILRHEYRHVDPEVLWSVITERLSELDNAAVKLLSDLPD